MPFTWNTADLGILVPGDPPVKLEYGDTHPNRCPTEPYTSIIALHGTAFNSNIWNEWLPYLDPNIRLIALNRRGFGHSSPIHKSRTNLPANTEAHGRYVVDTLAFVKYAVEKLGLPARDEKTGAGGVVLLGWSKGCSFVLSLLSLLAPASQGLPASHQIPFALLEPYLSTIHSHVKSCILYEPPSIQVGIPNPHAPTDASPLPMELTRMYMQGFVSMVPDDKRSLLEAALDTEDVTAHDIFSWNGVDAAEREVVAKTAVESVPPNMGLGMIFCEGTVIADCIEGAKWVIDRFGGRKNTAARVLPGGSHFFMATDPKVWNDAVVSLIQELDCATSPAEGP